MQVSTTLPDQVPGRKAAPYIDPKHAIWDPSPPSIWMEKLIAPAFQVQSVRLQAQGKEDSNVW